jgi:hypothetical protein
MKPERMQMLRILEIITAIVRTAFDATDAARKRSPERMRRRPHRCAAALAVLLCCAGEAALAAPTDDARAYGIASFGGANQCGTSGQSHSAHTASAAAFQAQMSFLSQLLIWGIASHVNNSTAGSNLFTDQARSSQCNCSSQDDTSLLGIDNAAVAYIHTHGGHGTAGKGSSFFLMGNRNAGNSCFVGTDTNFIFGNTNTGKLEIAIVKACQGADFDVFNQGGYRAMVPTTSRFQVYNGFHGDSSCGGFVASYVQDYAANSLADGVGENWMDEAYDYDFFGNDDCPSTIIYGNTKSARKAMFANGGFIDRQLANVSKRGSSYFFVAGCSPSNGRKLPE